MKVIWKYPLELVRPDGWLTASPTVEMPAGAQILTMQLQGRTPTLWALVDTAESRNEVRKLRIFGTGHPLPSTELEHLGTFQHEAFVFHVFEEKS